MSQHSTLGTPHWFSSPTARAIRSGPSRFARLPPALPPAAQDLTVKLAFLEFQSPTLGDAIAELVDGKHTTIHIAPLFMAQGGHLKHDVPQLLEDIRRHHPALKLDLLPAIGDVADLRDAIAGWLVSTVPGTSA